MSKSSNTTNAKKQKFLEMLLTCTTVKEAYKAAHISKATAARYQQDPEFQAQYRKMQRDTMEFTGNKLRSLTAKAITTLSQVMDNPKATPTEKTRAAKIVLDSAFQVENQQDIIDRLNKLESEVTD